MSKYKVCIYDGELRVSHTKEISVNPDFNPEKYIQEIMRFGFVVFQDEKYIGIPARFINGVTLTFVEE